MIVLFDLLFRLTKQFVNWQNIIEGHLAEDVVILDKETLLIQSCFSALILNPGRNKSILYNLLSLGSGGISTGHNDCKRTVVIEVIDLLDVETIILDP